MSEGRRRKRLILASVLLGAGAALLLSEVIVRRFVTFDEVTQLRFKGSRVTGRESWFKVSDNPVLLYENRWPQPWPGRKAPGTTRVLVLGDSTTNLGGPPEGFYPHLLQARLNATPGGKRYEVLNAGVIGYNTVQEAEYLEARLLDLAPDMVIVGYCTLNDRTVRRKLLDHADGLYCSDVSESYPYLLQLPFNDQLMSASALYRLLNLALVRAAERARLRPLTRRIKYFDLTFETARAVQRLHGLSRARGFRLIFVVIPPIDGSKREESRWILQQCAARGIEVVDVGPSFGRRGRRALELWPHDPCHFNRLGNELIAAALYRHLRGGAP